MDCKDRPLGLPMITRSATETQPLALEVFAVFDMKLVLAPNRQFVPQCVECLHDGAAPAAQAIATAAVHIGPFAIGRGRAFGRRRRFWLDARRGSAWPGGNHGRAMRRNISIRKSAITQHLHTVNGRWRAFVHIQVMGLRLRWTLTLRVHHPQGGIHLRGLGFALGDVPPGANDHRPTHDEADRPRKPCVFGAPGAADRSAWRLERLDWVHWLPLSFSEGRRSLTNATEDANPSECTRLPTQTAIIRPEMDILLYELARRQPAWITGVRSVNDHDAIARRLADLGFVRGRQLEVLRVGPFGGDPLLVKIGDTRFALRRAEAARISVSASAP